MKAKLFLLCATLYYFASAQCIPQVNFTYQNSITNCQAQQIPVSVNNSDPILNYTLERKSDSTVVAGPTAGDGGTIVLNTDSIDQSTNYVLRAKRDNLSSLFLNGYESQHANIPKEVTQGFSNEYTIEFWTYIEQLDLTSGSMSRLFFNGDGGGTTVKIQKDNLIWVLCFGTIGKEARYYGGLTPRTWYHMAFVHTNDSAKIYLNGSQVASKASTAEPMAENSILSGSLPHSNSFLAWAQYDNLRFWNKARTAQEIAANYNNCLVGNEPNLTGLFQFNHIQNNQTVIKDYGPGGHDGFLTTGWRDDFSGVKRGDVGVCNPCDRTEDVSITFDYTITGTSPFICEGETFQVGNKTYSSTGFYRDTLSNINGCDSIVNTNLTVTTINTGITANDLNLLADEASATSYQWLDCENSFASLPGESSRLLTASTEGYYAVELTKNGCVDTAFCGQASYCINDLAVDEDTLVNCNLPMNFALPVEVKNSQLGVNYFLRNESDDSVIDGPVAGTGGTITLTNPSVTGTGVNNIYTEKASHALTFDRSASSNYVEVPKEVTKSISNQFTIELWFYVRGTGGTSSNWSCMVDQCNWDSGNGEGFVIYHNNGQMYFRFAGQGRVVCPQVPVSKNQWQHLACTYDGQEMKLYLNGALVDSYADPNFTKASQLNLLIGAGYHRKGLTTVEDFFDGELDDVRIWKYARTQEDIYREMHACLKGSEPSLVALYHFNDGPGSSTTQDYGPNKHHGTLNNMNANTAWVNAGPTCSACTKELTDKVDVACQSIITNTLNLEGEQFKVYPNPLTDVLNVEFSQPQTGTLSIYNLNGKLLGEYPLNNQSRFSKGLSLSKGSYLLNIRTNHSNISKPLIVK